MLLPRTVLWVLLINAVPVAMLALMGGLVWFNAWFFTVSSVIAVKIAIFIVPTVLVLGRGLWVLFSKSDNSVHGVPVREHEQPELWALVRRLAVVADTKPPDDIHLVAEANASVREDTRLLGLISAQRRMFIGAPLVATMSSAQLAAVLTHELAHYSNRDTRFAGLAYRSRSAFTRTLATIDRGDRLQLGLHFLLRHYGAFVFRASAKLSRRQESLADEAAAAAVGSAATASALRELAPISGSWDVFENNHLVIGWDAGYLPADVFAGYQRLHVSLHDALHGLRTDPPDAADPFDSHPPLRERIAATDALGAVGTIHVPATSALGLLRDPLRLLDAAVLADLTPEARSKRRADWPTLIRISGISSLTENTDRVLANAARVTGGPPTLRALLDALDAGRLIELGADPDRAADPSDGPRVLRERARLIVHKALFGAVAAALTSAGAMHWTESWPSVGTMRLDERYPDSLPDLIDAALDDRPDTSRLRALLDSVRDSPGRPGHYGAAAR
ncbi:M48 family metalloprotease [Glycomyces rhizosphaerae]|uniref:M48 family metalloprotease n=1 Tax=Glycomyces rhizosphaerae TaxID=2054422 RepID=A0ABV7PZB3_9ACTN